MSDKVAVICTIALVRAISIIGIALANREDSHLVRVERDEIVAELQELGNRL